KTFARYLHELRLARAKQLLKGTSLSVEQVQKLVGFQTRTNFHRAFRKGVRMTPIEYRERWG
ncbi:MAG TPA: AraC family transcriptional regulator, partial [Polyangiaceae bacterium]|nr:AraC family transcriptional regulator [Polyangiaceae bacterium]